MNEKIKIKLELGSFTLSVLAILISIASFIYTVRKDNLDNTEQVNITNVGYGYNDFLNYNSSGGYRGQGMVDGINYTLILSNNSKQRISLISYDIFQEMENSKYQYKNMVKQIRDSSNQVITFPLSIESGASISLTFEINTLVPPSINMLLLDEYGTEGEISYENLRDYLGNKKRDLFGNEVTYTKFGDGGYHMEIDAPHYPIYSLKLYTSRGMVFNTMLTQMYQN